MTIYNCKITTPKWITPLVQGICKSIQSDGPARWESRWLAPSNDQEAWIVSISPPIFELKGGAKDGALLAPRCFMDVVGIQELFDASGETTVELRAGQVGQLVVCGSYNGNRVEFHILAAAPSDAKIKHTVTTKTVGNE